MSNLEHLVENGIKHGAKLISRQLWEQIMKDDPNWPGNENITIDQLWEVCQYVICTYVE